tara:strand:+ start:603 stop:803 length:201 start_codon:yes stop_codon:yes gene_type:complete
MKKFQIAFSSPQYGEAKLINTKQVSFSTAASFAYVEATKLSETTNSPWRVAAVYDLDFKIEETQLS